MTEDNKDKVSDKVITLEDFKRTEKQLEAGEELDLSFIPDNPVEHIIALAAKAGLTEVAISGVNANNRFEFFSSCDSAAETVYLLEAFKKIVLDTAIGLETGAEEDGE